MPNIIETVIGKITQLLESIFPKKSTEHATRREELRTQEFFARDEFEQRNYQREEKRTGIVDRAAEKPKKVW